MEQILDKITYIITMTIKSCKHKLNKEQRKGLFEIFGYDFILDTDFIPWLIEVNTNPCLEESSTHLKRLLPRMLGN